MALTEIGLSAVIQGVGPYLSNLDKMEAGEKKVAAGAKTVEDQAGKAGAALTKLSALGSAGLLGLAGVAVKMASDFQHEMSQVGAISGATAGELKQLSDAAKKIGADTAFSAGDAAKAMEELAAGGRSVAQIMGGEARAAVDLAAAGNYGLADSARTIATAMTVWEGTTVDTTDVVNRLAGAANTSRFGVDDMSQAIAQGGGVAAAAGISFQDFSTSIAATASSFSSGSDAGTSFKTFVTSLTGTSQQAKDMIEQLGLSFYTASGQIKPMSEIVQELHDKLGPLSQEEQTVALKTIFGNDAFRTAASLMKLTGAEFATMSKTMGDTNAQDIAKQRMDNLSGSIEQLKGSFETVAITLGSKVIPVLTTLTNEGVKVLNAFGEMPSSTQNMILAFTALTVATPALISGVSKTVEGIKAMGVAATTLRGQMAIGAAGLGLLLVAGDAIAQKTSGHGLIEWVFGDPTKIDATTAALHAAQVAFSAIVDPVDKVALAQSRIVDSAGKLDKALNTNSDSLKSVRTWLSPIPGIENETEQAISKTTGALLGNVQAYLELKPAFSDFQKLLQTLPPDVQKVVMGMQEYKDLLNAATVAGEGQNKALEAANQAWAGLEKATTSADVSVKAITHSGQELVDYMSSTWGPTLGEVFDTFDEETDAKLKNISGQFPDVQLSAEGLRSYLKDKFGPDGVKAFDDFHKAVGDTFKGMKDALATIFPAVDESFTAWKKRIDQMVVDQQNFEKNLKIIYKGISDAGVAMPDEILAAVAEKGPAFVAFFTKMYQEDPKAALEVLKVAAPAAMGESVDAITNRVIGGKPGMDAATTALINKPFEAALAEARKTADSEGRLIDEDLAHVLRDAAPPVTAESKKLVDDAIAAMKTAGTGTDKIGADMAEGVRLGLESGAERIVAAGRGLVRGAIDAMDQEADHHSASKKTIPIGKDLGDGVGVGLEDSRPGVVAVGTGLISDTADAMKARVGDDFSPVVDEIRQWAGKMADGLVELGDVSNTKELTKGLQAWQKVLAEGIRTNTSLTTEQIRVMMGQIGMALKEGIADGGPKAKEGFIKVFEAMQEGWKQTGSLSNEALIQFIEEPMLSGMTWTFGQAAAAVSSGGENVNKALAEKADHWKKTLAESLKEGKSLSTTEIESMFSDMYAIIEGSNLDATTRMKLEAMAQEFVVGFGQTGSAANAALIAMFAMLAKTAAEGAASVAAASQVPTGAPGTPTGGVEGASVAWVWDSTQRKWVPGGTSKETGSEPATMPSDIGAGMIKQLPLHPKVGDTFNGMVWNGTYWSQGGATYIPSGLPGYIQSGQGPYQIPQYAAGVDYVPRTMLALVHQGERIVPASMNTAITNSRTDRSVNVTVDMRGAQLTGTVDENRAVMMDVVNAALAQQLGRGALVAGVRR